MKQHFKRAKAVELLAAGYNQKQTSEKIGVTEKSLTRWMKEPAFKKEVQERIDATLAEYSGALRMLIPMAIKTYSQAMMPAAGQSKVSTAGKSAAMDILRSFGLLSDGVTQRETPATIELEPILEFGTPTIENKIIA